MYSPCQHFSISPVSPCSLAHRELIAAAWQVLIFQQTPDFPELVAVLHATAQPKINVKGWQNGKEMLIIPMINKTKSLHSDWCAMT